MSPDEMLADIFGLFSRGVADRRSVFHTPTVATIGANGAPDARTVVLRGCDPAARELTFHTDSRAAKVAQLRHRPDLALHVYDAGSRIQTRVAGLAALFQEDDRTLASWRAAAQSSRATYRVVQAPGSVVADPESVDSLGVEEDAAFRYFVVVRVKVACVEWLHLAASGHRRARFTWPDGMLRREWLVP